MLAQVALGAVNIVIFTYLLTYLLSKVLQAHRTSIVINSVKNVMF